MIRPILSIEPYTELGAALARCVALRKQRPDVEVKAGQYAGGYLVVSIHGRETPAPCTLGTLGRAVMTRLRGQ